MTIVGILEIPVSFKTRDVENVSVFVIFVTSTKET